MTDGARCKPTWWPKSKCGNCGVIPVPRDAGYLEVLECPGCKVTGCWTCVRPGACKVIGCSSAKG